ncbi:MAG: glycosyltransferase [Verrucomicrobium sp.]
MPIPPILHQTWRDEVLPERWVRFRETWMLHHPTWEHRLWTDAMLREFVAAKYPEFLIVYDGYPSPIMRSDAARYLLLDHFGGVYADLDMECLRPMEPLLEGQRLLLPLEPELHLSTKVAASSGIRRIVGNAWMASESGHPFWKLVISTMEIRAKYPGPLDATGPFMLSAVTNACEEPSSRPRLLPSVTVQPASNMDLEWLNARPPGSPHWFGPETYALHYWDGTWWRKGRLQTRIYMLRSAEPLVVGVLNEPKAAARAAKSGFNPLVSCLMVTGRRRALAELAVRAFRHQTYANRELVVIDDSGEAPPGHVTKDDDGGRIRWICVPAEGRPLGALRNVALAEARGDLLCQWDDDDLSSPARLERQARVLFATGADACGLNSLQMWWPAKDRFAISSNRIWECALMWRRGAITAYPEIKAGEDTPPVLELAAKGRICMMDASGLYTYICHGGNTFSDSHWDTLWSAASQRMVDADCRTMLRIMQPVLPVNEYLQALKLPPLDQTGLQPVTGSPVHTDRVAMPLKPAVTRELPRILVATPIRDAVPFLEKFFVNLAQTEYPLEKIRVAMLEGDSRDATEAYAGELLSEHSSRLAGTHLMRQDFGNSIAGERYSVNIQRQRRSVLARSRNLLVETALKDEEWVLWIDVDIQAWPSDIIHQLLKSRHQIVTPHCVQGAYGGPSFDLNTFVFRDTVQRDGPNHMHDGMHQPPKGLTRNYLEAYRDCDEVQVDGVGGTMLLVQADLHRDGLRFPAMPYRGFMETEGLAQMAREFGVTCWGLPKVEIVHG